MPRKPRANPDQIFIYALVDPTSQEIRYVGASGDPRVRLLQHINARSRETGPKAEWLRALVDRGVKPEYFVLEDTTRSEWEFWEQYWICQIRAWGHRLLNVDNGGLQSSRYTRDIRDRISRTLTGRSNVVRYRAVQAFSDDGFVVATYSSFQHAAREVGGSHSNIVRAIEKSTRAYGYRWKYAA